MQPDPIRARPANWASFNHYRDRNPPWVKLTKAVMEDRDFSRLPVASRALAPMLWLVATEDRKGEGWFMADPADLAHRWRLDVQEVEAGLSPLLASKFFEVEGAN